jgi:hypothetical protein
MLLVDNVLSRVFYGVRFVICKNPLIQIMGSLFPYSSIYMLKVSAGIYVFYITVKALGNRRQKVSIIPDFIFMKLSLNFSILTFLEVSEEDSQPKIKGSFQKQREARTKSDFG